MYTKKRQPQRSMRKEEEKEALVLLSRLGAIEIPKQNKFNHEQNKFNHEQASKSRTEPFISMIRYWGYDEEQ